ncbi:MAG: 50S ribosomal protein L20 [Leptospirales bacterium]|nr:50S ribosomal protein L20 [Leptospirales bacterium]
MRVKGGPTHKNSRNRLMKQAKGFRAGSGRLYRTALQAVVHAGVHKFASRKQFKRTIRSQWIVRINAACRINNVSYSVFMNGLKKSGIDMNRKMLANIAATDPAAFKALVQQSTKKAA